MLLDGDWFGTLPVQAACEFGKAIYCGTEVDFEPSVADQLRQQVEDSGIAFMAEFSAAVCTGDFAFERIDCHSTRSTPSFVLPSPAGLRNWQRAAHSSKPGRSQSARVDGADRLVPFYRRSRTKSRASGLSSVDDRASYARLPGVEFGFFHERRSSACHAGSDQLRVPTSRAHGTKR